MELRNELLSYIVFDHDLGHAEIQKMREITRSHWRKPSFAVYFLDWRGYLHTWVQEAAAGNTENVKRPACGRKHKHTGCHLNRAVKSW